MPRMLCIYPWLVLGGADKFNLDMLAQLQERGWRSTVVTTLPSDHSWREAFVLHSEVIVDLTHFVPSEWPARLLSLAQRNDVVLVSHSLIGYHILPYLRAHLPETAFVDYCHIVEPRWLDGGYPRISLRNAPSLDTQIVSSQQLKQWMIQQGGRSEKIEVCTTNIDPDDWDASRHNSMELREDLDIAPNAPVVLYAGRLTQQKQPPVAAEVMRHVAAQRPDVVFLVAGDGEYRLWMERFVRCHNLEIQVRLLGAVESKRIRELLAASNLFFLPSENEGISLALYEAMAMGVVPVSADVGGQAELVTPDCGILVQRSDREADDYAAAILGLLSDPERQQQMSRAGRERVRAHFSLKAMGERMDGLLSEAKVRRLNDQRLLSRDTALESARRVVAQANEDRLTRDRRWRARLRPYRIWRALVRRVTSDI